MFAPYRDVAFEQVANAELSTNRGCVDILPLIAARGLARDHAELAEAGQHVVEVVCHHVRDQGARLLATIRERQYGRARVPAPAPLRRQAAAAAAVIAMKGSQMRAATLQARWSAGPGLRGRVEHPVQGLKWAAPTAAFPRARRRLWPNWRRHRLRSRAMRASP